MPGTERHRKAPKFKSNECCKAHAASLGIGCSGASGLRDPGWVSGFDAGFLKPLSDGEPSIEGEGRGATGAAIDFADEVVGEVSGAHPEGGIGSSDEIAVLDFNHVSVQQCVEDVFVLVTRNFCVIVT